MNKQLKKASSCLLYIGVLGYFSNKHLGINNAVADIIFFAALAIGLFGTSLFKWVEQRAKNKGKGIRAVGIASTAYFAFVVIIYLWAILEKLDIL